MGSTKMGGGDNADFFDVMSAGLLGLLKGVGGGSQNLNGVDVNKLTKIMEEVKAAAEAGAGSLERILEDVNSSQVETNSDKKDPAQQEPRPRSIPTSNKKEKSTQISTFGRKDSVGQDGSVWDVPVVIPIKKQ